MTDIAKFTKEKLTRIIDSAEEVITALAGTNDDIHPDNSKKMCAAWDYLNDHAAPPEVVRSMARQLLASMEQDPIYQLRDSDWYDTDKQTFYTVVNAGGTGRIVYAEPQLTQPAVRIDFLPKNLDRALGVMGMALPESREEFNLQQERWTQRLIDRVIRCADELGPQPAVVIHLGVTWEDVPEEITEDDMGLASAWAHGFNQCRAVMLQGNHRDLSQPVDPQVAAYEKIMQQALPANSFTNADLEGMAHGDNPQSNAYRELLAYRTGAPALTAGWVAVPVEPTESMIIDGFEAELREEFRDPEAYEAFEAMSGCEQAAQRAKWCWAAMIAATPQQEVNQ